MIVIPEPVYGLYQQSTSIDTYIDFEKLSD